MLDTSGGKRERETDPDRKDKKKMVREPPRPFRIIKESPTLQVLTTKILARHDTILVWAMMDNPEHQGMTVIKQPESFQRLLASQEFAELFKALGLTETSRLAMYGINVSMVYEMLENMNDQGLTTITDSKGEVHEVLMIEEIVGQALSLPTSQFPLRERRQHSALTDIFEEPKNTGNTYTQMKSSAMADQIRVLQHMFKLPKQQRHTMPELAFVHAVDDARMKRINAKKNWRQFFHQEILEAAKQQTHKKYMACGEFLTRIAYWMIG